MLVVPAGDVLRRCSSQFPRLLPLWKEILMLRWLWKLGPPVVAIALFGMASAARADTLANLMATNGVIVQGDKTFSNFTYDPHGNASPGAANVTITGIGSGVGADYYGIRISGGFNDAADNVVSDWLITYDVTVTDPNYRITDAHMASNVDANSGAGYGTITESFLPNGPQQITVFNINPGMDQPTAENTFGLPGYTVLHVQKDIQLSADTGIVTMSFIDQRFSQTSVVPLPATANMGIALIVCLGGFGAWRKLKVDQNAMA